MNGSLFHSEKLGRSPQYFWYGMVVGGSEWEDNQKDEPISKHKIHDRDDVAGWGHRCKVAIMGYDPRIVDDKAAKNSELVMAEVMLPTTGGGGIGGPVITPTLGNNSFVIGFFKDGVNAREPIIMGVLPNVSQSRLKPYNEPETTRYDASTGYRPGEDPVANDALWPDGDKMETGEMVRPHTIMLQAHKQDGDATIGIPTIQKCQKINGQTSLIQTAMQQMMNIVNMIKRGSSSIASAASDALKNISAIVTTTTNLISGYVTNILGNIRSFVLSNTNGLLQSVLNNLPTNLVSNFTDKITNPAINALSCTFNNIIKNAKGIVGNFLNDLIGGAVNSFFSTASALIGDFLTNTLGSITSAIDSALSLIGSVANVAEILANPLDSIFGLMNLLSCQEDQYCPAITEWNFLYGTASSPFISSQSTSVSDSYNPSSPTTASQATQEAFPVLSGPPLISTVGGGQGVTPTSFTPAPQPTSTTTSQQVGQQADAEGQAFAAQEIEITRTGSSQSSYDLGDGASLQLF